MKILKKTTEDDMIAIFLKTEIDSKRFSDKLNEILINKNIDLKIIINPNIKNKEENDTRRYILNEYRGYEDKNRLFEGFPTNIEWYYILLNKDDIRRIRYINYDYWVELSKGSRYAIDAAKNIRKGIEVYGISNKHFIEVSEAFKRRTKFEPLILIAPIEDKEDMIVLEGHLRLTAYALAINYFDKIKVIVGYSSRKELEKWCMY
jgi:hypothetical protein